MGNSIVVLCVLCSVFWRLADESVFLKIVDVEERVGDTK